MFVLLGWLTPKQPPGDIWRPSAGRGIMAWQKVAEVITYIICSSPSSPSWTCWDHQRASTLTYAGLHNSSDHPLITCSTIQQRSSSDNTAPGISPQFRVPWPRYWPTVHAHVVVAYWSSSKLATLTTAGLSFCVGCGV